MPANVNSGLGCVLVGVWVIMPLKYLIFLAGQLVSYSYLQWRQSVRFNMAASLMVVPNYKSKVSAMRKLIFLVLLCGLCGLFGFGLGRQLPLDPDPEQCLSVCVAEFERMGC